MPDTAVILAAGMGSRLAPLSHGPKPLTTVLGVSLAERVMRTLRAAGVERFVVTLGHEAEAIEAHFSEVARRLGSPISFASSPTWQRGNGDSALAARDHVGDEPFLLVMSDHLFDPEIARALTHEPPAPGEMCLAVDYGKDRIFDLEDVTRVRVADGRIVEIAKTLDPWDAGDTGVMLCTAGLFEGLERAAARGEHGLSDGLRQLAGEGRARVVDVTGHDWIDVDTGPALREAERMLLRGLVKETDGFLARHVNRRVSLAITRRLTGTRVTPNAMTLVSACVGLAGAPFFLAGTTRCQVIGALLFLAHSILDGCDGELARLKYQESRLGGVLDFWGDNLVHVAVFACMAVGWSLAEGAAWPLALGALAVTGTAGSAGFVYWRTLRRAPAREGPLFTSTAAAGRPPDRLSRLMDGLARRDFIYLVVLLSAFGKASWFLVLAAVGAPVFLALLIWRAAATPSPPSAPRHPRRRP